MNTQRIIQFTAVGIAAAGFLLLAPFGYFWMQQRQAMAHAPVVTVSAVASAPAPTPTLITGKPTQLSISSLNINLAVTEGVYNESTRQWSISNDKAHYALPTIQPNNESGNTLIYGHYREGVFSTLRLIQPGAIVTVDTDSGYRFTYSFRTSEKVTPMDTSIFTYKGKPQLTIQTCTGAYMQDRHLFYFDFVSAEKL